MGYTWIKEAYVEFGLASVIVALRVLARTRAVGFRGWQGDDYLILVTWALNLGQAIAWPLLYRGNGIRPSPTMSKHDMDRLTMTLKTNQAMWTMYLTQIWSLKACMLFLYRRLTRDLPHYRVVKIAAWMVGITYVVCFVELYVHCLPLRKIWQIVPNPGKLCNSSLVNFYVIGLSNFLTDALLLSIPMPLLYGLHLPLRRKLIVGLLLCSGVFVMAATLTRMIIGLMQIDGIGTKDRTIITQYALRETFVAILAVNAPCIKPLFSPKSWLRSHRSYPSSSVVEMGGQTIGSKPSNDHSGRCMSKSFEPGVSNLELNDVESAKSSEGIIERGNKPAHNGGISGLEIHRTTTIEVGDTVENTGVGLGRRGSETTCSRA